MKQRKLKKKSIIFLLLIILIITLSIIFIPKQFNKKDPNTNDALSNNTESINYIEVVTEKLKNHNISREFIEWIDNNYDNSIEKLYTILKNNDYDISMWHEVTGYSYLVLNDLYTNKYDNMNIIKILDSKDEATLSFVGDVTLADDWFVAPKYDERNKGIYGILSSDTVEIMNNSDVMVANSEFTVSNRGSSMEGKYYTFRAKPERLAIYYEMGVDLVTLGNNHVYDYGQDAFLDMLDAFKEYKIPYIGAGHNLEEASAPYYFIINGYKIAFLNGTRAEKFIMTPGATEDSEGVFRCYDPTNMINKINEVKKESDYVIVIMHYGKEGSHDLEPEQVKSSKLYIDAGADIIVGHHAHTLQGIEFYNNKPIIYNLGNFIFNLGTDDTAIFQIKLKNDGSMEYYIIPAQQKDVFTQILYDEEKARVIADLNSWSVNANIDSNGKITEIK